MNQMNQASIACLFVDCCKKISARTGEKKGARRSDAMDWSTRALEERIRSVRKELERDADAAALRARYEPPSSAPPLGLERLHAVLARACNVQDHACVHGCVCARAHA